MIHNLVVFTAWDINYSSSSWKHRYFSWLPFWEIHSIMLGLTTHSCAPTLLLNSSYVKNSLNGSKPCWKWDLSTFSRTRERGVSHGTNNQEVSKNTKTNQDTKKTLWGLLMFPETIKIEQWLDDALSSCVITASDQMSEVIFPPLCVYLCMC